MVGITIRMVFDDDLSCLFVLVDENEVTRRLREEFDE